MKGDKVIELFKTLSNFTLLMTNESTINKLIEMCLTAMADAFRIQKDDPFMKEVPFDDRLGMLVDIEYTSRKNNRLKRLIRKAEFEQPDASVAAIDYHLGRTQQSPDRAHGEL